MKQLYLVQLLLVLMLTGPTSGRVLAEHPLQSLDPVFGNPAKLVFLTIEADEYIISDIRSNRFVELRRKAKEQLIDSAEAKQVVVLVTNQRMIAYSALTQGWTEQRVQAGEKFQSVRAEDFAALVTTNQRLLNYNGANGIWTEHDR